MLPLAIISFVLTIGSALMKEWNGFNFFLFLTMCSAAGYALQLIR